jgi:hypothetical protein
LETRDTMNSICFLESMPLLVVGILLQAFKYTSQKVVLKDNPNEPRLGKEVYSFLGREQRSRNHWHLEDQCQNKEEKPQFAWRSIKFERSWWPSKGEKEKNMGEED